MRPPLQPAAASDEPVSSRPSCLPPFDPKPSVPSSSCGLSPAVPSFLLSLPPCHHAPWQPHLLPPQKKDAPPRTHSFTNKRAQRCLGCQCCCSRKDGVELAGPHPKMDFIQQPGLGSSAGFQLNEPHLQ